MAIEIRVEQRDPSRKVVRDIRRQGNIPAVLYGHGVDNLSVVVGGVEFRNILSDISSSTIMNLTIQGEGSPRSVLVNDIQYHPISGDPIHIDFQQVTMTESVRATVPIEFIGVSSAVKDQGGTLVRDLDELEVEALPQHLPERITVDISQLTTFDEQIRVKDLPISKEVEVLNEPDGMVAYVAAPRTEEELENLESEAIETPADVKTEAEAKREEEAKKEEESGTSSDE